MLTTLQVIIKRIMRKQQSENMPI